MAAQTSRIEAGELLLPEEAPWLGLFERELLAFPAGRHDDQVDALSQLAYLAATLRAILDGHPQSQIDDLMPWRFPTPSSRAA